MPRNIEIKARISNIAVLLLKVAAMADTGPVELIQDDTYFHCPTGRLKLRSTVGRKAELIFYDRPEQSGPKESVYVRTTVVNSQELKLLLSRAYGERGRVQKRRTLFLFGRTRVHLDQVERLGDFLELEVVMAEGDAADDGVAEARRLMLALGIAEDQLIERAYIDLVEDNVSP